MLSMRLLTRVNLPQYAATAPRLHTSSSLYDSSESSSSDSDRKSTKKKLKPKPVQSEEQKLQAQQDTKNRLNSLLEKMIKEPKTPRTLDLSVPAKKSKTQEPPKKTYEQSLFGAAKEVATSLGGDVRKTESDLLNKLLSTENNKSEESLKDPKTPLSLSELVAGMKIDRTPAKSSAPQTNPRMARAQAVGKEFESMRSTKFQRRHPGARMRDPRTAESAHLYEGKPLLIFDKPEKIEQSSEIPKLTTWEALQKREFKLTLSHPPENIFQEMIMWTEQGKLWKFPIDNEQGLEEEQSVHFSEHVFMERHLQDWCPRRGPIRHFMELVCVGLSKNPYMTVQEKKEHIAWFREYFASKQDLLKELNAIEADIPLPSKQIEA